MSAQQHSRVTDPTKPRPLAFSTPMGVSALAVLAVVLFGALVLFGPRGLIGLGVGSSPSPEPSTPSPFATATAEPTPSASPTPAPTSTAPPRPTSTAVAAWIGWSSTDGVAWNPLAMSGIHLPNGESRYLNSDGTEEWATGTTAITDAWGVPASVVVTQPMPAPVGGQWIWLATAVER